MLKLLDLYPISYVNAIATITKEKSTRHNLNRSVVII